MSAATEAPPRSGQRRRALLILAGFALLVLTAYAYSATRGDSNTSTARVLVLRGSPDSLIRPSPAPASTLQAWADIARSFPVALAAAQRTSRPYRDTPAFVRAATKVQRTVRVTVSAPTRTLLLTARASSSAAAERLANAYADGLLQVVAARSLNLADRAMAAVAHGLARPLTSARARRAATANVTRFLIPLVFDTQIQIVRPVSQHDTGPVASAAIAAVIALLSLLVLLLVTGVWRPRAATP
jgi:hypothetical protein